MVLTRLSCAAFPPCQVISQGGYELNTRKTTSTEFSCCHEILFDVKVRKLVFSLIPSISRQEEALL